MSAPILSVVMPVFNGEKYIKEAIESILTQTFSDFEFIIINDGSTDSSEKIILSYNDPRIIYLKNATNLQIEKTLNKGIKQAKGKYIARMDSDDVSKLKRFEKQVKFMEDNPSVDVSGCWFEMFGGNNYIQKLPLKHNQIKSDLLFYTPIAHPTIIMKRSVLKKNKYLDGFPKAEDYALWVSLIEKYRFANIPEVLYKYRFYPDQTSQQYSEVQNESSLLALHVFMKPFLKKLSEKDLNIHKKIFLNDKIDLEEIEKYLLLLLQLNKTIKCFDQLSLRKTVFWRWQPNYFSLKQSGIAKIRKYYSSPLYITGQLPFKKNIQFVIKNIYHYLKKK